MQSVLDASNFMPETTIPTSSTLLPPDALYDFHSPSLSDVTFDLPALDDYFYTDATLLSLTDLPSPSLSVSGASLLTPDEQHSNTLRSSHAVSTSTTPLHQPTTRPTTPTPLICGCQQSILSKLSELSLKPLASGTAVPFDRALSENRAIVALCTGTLDCAACTGGNDFMLGLTLGALVAHVLVVFDAFFCARREALQLRDRSRRPAGGEGRGIGGGLAKGIAGTTVSKTASIGSNTSSITAGEDKGDARTSTTTRPVRLSLGSYELDERDEQILQTSLLKIELGKITELVEAYGRRFCRFNNELSDSDMISSNLHVHVGKAAIETKLHHDLVVYLKQRLGANYESLKSLFASGQGTPGLRNGGRGGLY
jgi:hypothetical protein